MHSMFDPFISVRNAWESPWPAPEQTLGLSFHWSNGWCRLSGQVSWHGPHEPAAGLPFLSGLSLQQPRGLRDQWLQLQLWPSLWPAGGCLALHVLTPHHCILLTNVVCASFGSLGVLRSMMCARKDTSWPTLWLTLVLSIGSRPWGSLPRWTLWCPICKKIIWSWRWVSGSTRTTLPSLPHPVQRQLMLWPSAGLGRPCGLAWTSWMLLMRPLVLKGRLGYTDKLLVCADLACVIFQKYLWLAFLM